MVELRIKIISIHALREEGDAQIEVKVFDDFFFLSTPLREEGDAANPFKPLRGRVFLSTPSARRATLGVLVDDRVQHISIHALREEGDCEPLKGFISTSIFLSTPSARRATMLQRAAPSLWIFLSTPSARRATRADLECFSHRQFLSTPSARRATSLDPLHMVLRLIFIHALREEGDHITSTVKYTAAQISIHALREEGDIASGARGDGDAILSTPSARRATLMLILSWITCYFLSTPSARRATPSIS